MTGRQRFALAMAASLLLHLAMVVGPGWRVPKLNDALLPESLSSSSSSSQLEAHLTAQQRRSAPTQPAAQPPQRPPARPKSPRVHVPASSGVLAMPEDVEPQLAPGGMETFAPSLASAAGSADVRNAAAEAEKAAAPVSISSAAAPEIAAPGDAVRSNALPVEISLPRSGSIRFSVEKGFAVGESVHRWSHDGKEYSLTSLTQTTGLAALFQPVRLTWASAGMLDGSGLRPREFHVEKNGVAGDSAEFDWTAMRLALSSDAQAEVPLVSGAQDMLSVFYQLGVFLPALVDGAAMGKTTGKAPARVEIAVATGRKFEHYGFDVVGEELLSLKIGKYRTIHLRTASGREATEVWLAPGLRNLPLKIRITDRKGDSYDQIAESIEFEGMPPDAGRR